MNTPSPAPAGQLGTFAGVFTPSILTILGLVLFLRTGYVVGGAGLSGALLIILVANTLSVLTSLSLSAIATNLRVRGGGDYYLISRTLGVEYGGALGIVLFLAQAVSVAFYSIGFAEIVTVMLGLDHPLAGRAVAWSAVALLLAPAWFGADWASRFQYGVMAILFTTIALFLIGGLLRWDAGHLGANWSPSAELGFWPLFAIFFPAVTGFTQGVSMSGDLRDPATSLPRGTFLAVLVSLLVYLAAALIFAAAVPGKELLEDPQIIRQVVPWPWLADLGIIAATLSSALASFLGAPRILQALAADRIFRLLDPFAKGVGEHNNPRRGVLLTLMIAATTIALGGLNVVAGVVTMFFLISYGLLNYATFAEARGNSPYFRPRFRFFHAHLSLLGALGCGAAMLAINPLVGMTAVAIMLGIRRYLAGRGAGGSNRFSAADRSHRLQRIRSELHALSAREDHPRDWRPVVLAFSDDPGRRKGLLDFAWWMEGQAGFTTLITLQKGQGPRAIAEARQREQTLREEIREQRLDAFVRVIAAPDTKAALPVVLQAYGMGRIGPNTVLLNWFDQPREADGKARQAYGENLRMALVHDCNVIILSAKADHFTRIERLEPGERRIDVWYRPDATGQLTLMLAYLMTRNDPWKDAPLRLLVSAGGRGQSKVLEEVEAMLKEIRIAAQAVVVEQFDIATLRELSSGSAALFLPFDLRGAVFVSPFGKELEEQLETLPLTALACAAQGVELEADTDEEPEEGTETSEAADSVGEPTDGAEGESLAGAGGEQGAPEAG